MDVSAWLARFRTGFDKCFAGILVGVLRTLNYRSKKKSPPHSFRLVPREDFEYWCLQRRRTKATKEESEYAAI